MDELSELIDRKTLMDQVDELFDPKTLTRFLKLGSERTLEGWRHRGCGPPFIRVSPRAVRYRRRDVERWLAERRVGDEVESPVSVL